MIAPRVIVVDDNQDFATLLASGLRTLDYDTRIAFDARHALELAVDFQPAAMLIDIGLPGTSGWSLARKIRTIPLIAPRLIAVTALDQPVHRERSVAAGFFRHLVKPVRIPEVVAVLRAPC